MRPSVRRAPLTGGAGPARSEQTVDHRKLEKKFTFPRDVTGTVEYRAAAWAQKTFPASASSCPAPWRSGPTPHTNLQQFTGGSFTMATNLRCSSAPTPPSDSAPASVAAGRASHADVAARHTASAWSPSAERTARNIGGRSPIRRNSTECCPALWHESGVTSAACRCASSPWPTWCRKARWCGAPQGTG